jgi:hypothetical protein
LFEGVVLVLEIRECDRILCKAHQEYRVLDRLVDLRDSHRWDVGSYETVLEFLDRDFMVAEKYKHQVPVLVLCVGVKLDLEFFQLLDDLLLILI